MFVKPAPSPGMRQGDAISLLIRCDVPRRTPCHLSGFSAQNAKPESSREETSEKPQLEGFPQSRWHVLYKTLKAEGDKDGPGSCSRSMGTRETRQQMSHAILAGSQTVGTMPIKDLLGSRIKSEYGPGTLNQMTVQS